jgi:hypothetical protein
MRICPSPLFRDPVMDGPADPTIIWNPTEKAWWIIYTARRAAAPGSGVSWVHGTDLGVCSSDDNGQTWLYRGTLTLEAIEPGRNTFWAPEVLWQGGLCHMYVSYITGVPDSWRGPRRILHYTSTDLWNWRFESALPLPGGRAIDACVYPLPKGGYRLWYKDESGGSFTSFADSPDLYAWKYGGIAVDDCAQEGPNVFALDGRYWLVADRWEGMAVYHSADLNIWTRQDGDILSEAGARPDDGSRGHHGDVLDTANGTFIFYFTHPGAREAASAGEGTAEIHAARRSSLQAAALTVRDGKLQTLRDEPFGFFLPEP